MAFHAAPAGQGMQNRKILEQLEEQKKRLRQGSSTSGVPFQSQVPPGPYSSGHPGTGMSFPVNMPPSTFGMPTPPSVSTLMGGSSGMTMAPQGGVPLVEPHHPNTKQRAALQHAQMNSVGYFIAQDSSFGNLILPVLPRLDKT